MLRRLVGLLPVLIAAAALAAVHYAQIYLPLTRHPAYLPNAAFLAVVTIGSAMMGQFVPSTGAGEATNRGFWAAAWALAPSLFFRADIGLGAIFGTIFLSYLLGGVPAGIGRRWFSDQPTVERLPGPDRGSDSSDDDLP